MAELESRLQLVRSDILKKAIGPAFYKLSESFSAPVLHAMALCLPKEVAQFVSCPLIEVKDQAGMTIHLRLFLDEIAFFVRSLDLPDDPTSIAKVATQTSKVTFSKEFEDDLDSQNEDSDQLDTDPDSIVLEDD